MTDWNQVNAHATSQGISPEAQRQAAVHLSPVRHLSDVQFKDHKPKVNRKKVRKLWLE